MKKQLFYLLLCVSALATGCIKDNDVDDTPILQPQGNFSGQFIRIHYNPSTKLKDTTKLNVQMQLESNTFKFTGDTSLHAGSNGTFNYNRTLIEWVDKTVPTGANSLNLPKPHLNGIYAYVYDGTDFKFEAYNDTLLYHYDLKKQAN